MRWFNGELTWTDGIPMGLSFNGQQKPNNLPQSEKKEKTDNSAHHNLGNRLPNREIRLRLASHQQACNRYPNEDDPKKGQDLED